MNLKDMVLLLSLCGNNSSPNPDVNLTGYATEKWVTEGFSPKGTAATAVSQHNTAGDSHNDIRLELQAINDRLTAFFDSDNQTLDELSEIVAYITSNKTLIDSITTSKVNVTDIINNLATNVSNKPLSAAQGVALKGLIDAVSNSLANYQPKGNYLTQHQDISGKLDASALPSAINTALAQAKASGEFDGEPGERGERGLQGLPGTSAMHTWDGSVLTITSASGISSADLKGPQGVPGANPVRGVDYWTEADKAVVIQEVIDSLGGVPVFGVVDSNNNIVLTGNLAEGVYTLKYEDADGNVTEIGTLNHTNAPEVTYTNLFDPATASVNTRMSGSSGASKAQDGYVMTASIILPSPVAVGSTHDENTPYIAVPSAMWSGSASVFGYADDGDRSHLDFNGTPGTAAGAWKKVPLYNQWGDSLTITSIVVSLYVKGSAITTSDIQNIEIYFNECPE